MLIETTARYTQVPTGMISAIRSPLKVKQHHATEFSDFVPPTERTGGRERASEGTLVVTAGSVSGPATGSPQAGNCRSVRKFASVAYFGFANDASISAINGLVSPLVRSIAKPSVAACSHVLPP